MGGPSIVHLPDGRNFTVKPVFAGLFFKSHELSTHPHAFPIGWTIVLHTEIPPKTADPTRPNASDFPTVDGRDDDDDDDARKDSTEDEDDKSADDALESDREATPGRPRTRAYTKPTLQNDCLFISSISNPSSTNFKPAASPTRQIAMMLWITLYWYFQQQPEPSPILPATAASIHTPEAARPRGEWRINIRRDGVLRGRNLIPKLERMGLISSFDSALGTTDHLSASSGAGWANMFVSRRSFWQVPARLYLFTLQPNQQPHGDSSYPGTPVGSRPASPASQSSKSLIITSVPDANDSSDGDGSSPILPPVASITSHPSSFPISPFYSTSHLPTYYPPAPAQYTMTNNVRHPVRPKPPRAGEVFYTRFIPSTGAYVSFRVASLSPQPISYHGPVGPPPTPDPYGGAKDASVSRIRAAAIENSHLRLLTDQELLESWLSKPRVAAFWGSYVPEFLPQALAARNSFPVIALWDGVPFGYLEIYWVKEDAVGRHLAGFAGGTASDWDRGVHALVGEEWARGLVPLWLTSVVHWIFVVDYRTMSVCCEPRVDNQRFIQRLQESGFQKEMELSLPHKQAWFGRLRRENFEGPAL